MEKGNTNRTWFTRALISGMTGLIRFYQLYLSPLKGPTCRFSPTCSEYARLAILRHGPVRGLGLAIWRLLRCQPFAKGGYDPVPD